MKYSSAVTALVAGYHSLSPQIYAQTSCGRSEIAFFSLHTQLHQSVQLLCPVSVMSYGGNNEFIGLLPAASKVKNDSTFCAVCLFVVVLTSSSHPSLSPLWKVLVTFLHDPRRALAATLSLFWGRGPGFSTIAGLLSTVVVSMLAS